MEYAVVKVVGDNVVRSFYGVTSVSRTSRDGMPLEAKDNETPFEEQEFVEYGQRLSVYDMADAKVEVIIGADEELKGSSFFALKDKEEDWTLVFFRGSVYICNEEGTTVDSFRS